MRCQKLLRLFVVFGAVFLAVAAVGAQNRQVQTSPESGRYWVFFKDKGRQAEGGLQKAAVRGLSPRAVRRRLLRAEPAHRFDAADLPVAEKYVSALEALGARIRVRSRWLNAVSVTCDAALLSKIARLPFVKGVQPVRTFTRRLPPVRPKRFEKALFPADTSLYNYGFARQQIVQLRVPALHEQGLTGKGVLVTLIDTGFRYQIHRAFQALHVVAEWDFINNDPVTHNEAGQDSSYQDFHGTEVLSVIAGYLPGKLIGPAFGADYALAKTEFVPSETRIEEDHWVAAAEWADSLGTDIISTSLGYRDFDNGFAYTYSDLDGVTMVTSKAATIAVSKGIVVVAAAGNEGNNPAWPYVTSPADGRGVIAVGAVNAKGDRVSFSSIGPTADGRIKPDVMAMGLQDAMVNPRDSVQIGFGSGTSFAAPLVAGVCALILEKHPAWTPHQVWQALTETASQAVAPDNFYGWGIVNAQAAAAYVFPEEIPKKFAVTAAPINPERQYSVFVLDLPETRTVRVRIFNILGQQVARLEKNLHAGPERKILWRWPPEMASGVYFARIQWKNQVRMQKTMILR